jgi:hypothetical protein
MESTIFNFLFFELSKVLYEMQVYMKYKGYTTNETLNAV